MMKKTFTYGSGQNPIQFLNFKVFIIVFLIILALVIFFNTTTIVGAGQRVVVFNSFTGVEKSVLGEGMNLLIPFVEHPIVYDVRTHSYTMSERTDDGNIKGDDAIECLTADGQKIKLDLSVIYSLDPNNVWKLHKQIGPNYLDKIIRPIVRSVARNTVASYPVIDLYSTKRAEVQSEIEKKLKEELAKYYIVTNEVLIRNVIFSEDFAKAIEMKQVALQEAERMRYILEKEKKEKDRKIIEAEGIASAITKKGEALRRNPQLIQYEYVSKLAPNVKTIITNQNSIMNLPTELFKDTK